MVTRRSDQAEASVEFAIETVDIPLDQLRAYRQDTRQPDLLASARAVPLPKHGPSTSTHRVERNFGAMAPLTTVSRRVAGLCGLAVIFLVVSNLSSQTVSGADWSKSFGWPALPILFVCLGFQMTTRATVVDQRGLARRRLWTRQVLALLGPIALPTIVVTGVAMIAGAATMTLGTPEIEAGLAAVTLSSNLFANGFDAGLDSALAPALSHLWATALVAQFGFLLVFLAGPISRRGDRGQVAGVVAVTAAAIAVTRLALLVVGNVDAGTVVVNPATGMDALLAGAALALLPPEIGKGLDRRFGWIAIGVLVGVFGFALAASASDHPAWVWGVLAPAAAGAVVAVAGSGIRLVDRLLSSFLLRWLGQRALGILIAHQLLGFALGLSTGTETTTASNSLLGLPQHWDRAASVGLQLVFALAIGSVNHRYLQVPLMQVASRKGFSRNTGRLLAGPGEARLGSSSV